MIENLLKRGLETETFTAAEALVAEGARVRQHIRAGAVRCHSKFDLSSLTKPLAVTNLVLRFAELQRLDLEQSVGDFFKTKTLKAVTVRDLLEHRSGLIAWHPFFKDEIANPKPPFARLRRQMIKSILNDKAFLGTSKMVYSDLNFMLLGAILEKTTGRTLDALFRQKIASPLRVTHDLHYIPLPARKIAQRQYVPSEVCRQRGRLIQAEVQDENAFVMGGVSGHAGLFGTAEAVHKTLLGLSRVEVIRQKLQNELKSAFAGRRRFVLGFDTVSAEKSHFGKRFDRKNTLCHLGFSGTSFAWDMQRDLFVVLLTNRCFFGRDNTKIFEFRRHFHDAVFDVL